MNNKTTDHVINASHFGEFQIENHKEPNVKAIVSPLSKVYTLTEQNLSEIVKICNQHDIYELLFREGLQGEKYPESKARSFVSWANQGWEEHTHFVYLIKTLQDQVIGAIDIKSNNPEFGEIGYWMSAEHPGFMTNALVGLISQAKEAGYLVLVAYTKEENDKSKGVLTRAGFQYVDKEERKPGEIRDKFILKI